MFGMGFMQLELENEEIYQEDNQWNGEFQYIQVSEICKCYWEFINIFVFCCFGYIGKQQSVFGKQIQCVKCNYQWVNFGIDN